MNILFLTLYQFNSIYEHNIYPDLLREFIKHGHKMYTISPIERRSRRQTYVVRQKNSTILRLKIGNIQKTNVIEKGFSTILVESTYIRGIKKYFSNIKFELILYSTPPITLCRAIEYVKRRDGAKTYLLLKDIFPQNSVDLGILSKHGIKALLYRFFRSKEKKLYVISDYIGCMSPANARYILRHNRNMSPEKVSVCPNCVEPADLSADAETRRALREKYDIPQNKTVFVYGGNLGKPQCVEFIIKCLQQCSREDAFFLIAGNGTDYFKLKAYVDEEHPVHVKLMPFLPKEDYDRLISCCDVGLIFLDYRFTIPNFPSRLLNYLQAKLPVLACTDSNTDLGEIITKNGFGYWCESTDPAGFCELAGSLCKRDLTEAGERGYHYMLANYTVEKCFRTILQTIGE